MKHHPLAIWPWAGRAPVSVSYCYVTKCPQMDNLHACRSLGCFCFPDVSSGLRLKGHWPPGHAFPISMVEAQGVISNTQASLKRLLVVPSTNISLAKASHTAQLQVKGQESSLLPSTLDEVYGRKYFLKNNPIYCVPPSMSASMTNLLQ